MTWKMNPRITTVLLLGLPMQCPIMPNNRPPTLTKTHNNNIDKTTDLLRWRKNILTTLAKQLALSPNGCHFGWMIRQTLDRLHSLNIEQQTTSIDYTTDHLWRNTSQCGIWNHFHQLGLISQLYTVNSPDTTIVVVSDNNWYRYRPCNVGTLRTFTRKISVHLKGKCSIICIQTSSPHVIYQLQACQSSLT